MFLALSWIAMSYLLGSFPFGLVIAQSTCSIDPRLSGSRNTGATNVARLCGAGWGVLTLVLDVAKGFLPTIVATAFSDNWLFLSCTALAAILGHMFSPFLSYRGGKAVATTIGVFLALAPWAVLAAIVLCVAVIAVSGYVSLGSLTLVAALPLAVLILGQFGLLLLALVVLALVVWRHRENIERLARGEEKSWRKRS